MYRVVIVDDEYWNTQGLKKLIAWEEHGFTVEFCSCNPIEAIDFIDANHPEVLITDILMPSMSGIQLIHTLRERGLNLECVIFSGYDNFSYAQQAINEDVAGYYLKPVKAAELIAILAKTKRKLDAQAAIHKDTLSLADSVRRFESEHIQLNNIIAYINENITEKLYLKDIAERHYINADYCCVLFKKHLNTTYSEYLNTIRTEKAKALLRDLKMTIYEIASVVGYSDYFYFNKVFKKYVGMTPKKYREQARNPDSDGKGDFHE